MRVEGDFCELRVLVSVCHCVAHRDLEELEEGSFGRVADDVSIHDRKSELIEVEFGAAAKSDAVHQRFPAWQSFVTRRRNLLRILKFKIFYCNFDKNKEN